MSDEPPSRPVHVVAGVIRDNRGRVLLARRTEGRDLAGRWEFPGGKVEPGESPEAALARELHEELGITVEIGEPLISVPQDYPGKRLRLDVRDIRHWRGPARGRENQALAWVPMQKLPNYSMPPADVPVVAALLQPDRYLVTPAPRHGEEDAWLDALDRALAAGVRRVQLRAAGANPTGGGDGQVAAEAQLGNWRSLVEEAVDRCRRAGAEVLVNADTELANEHRIGVHLTALQLAGQGERPVPAGVPLAASCHSVQELRAAEALGCDFAVVGAIRETPSHPGQNGIGWDAFARMREHVSIPLYAIGGLTPEDIPAARQQGAQGIAAIRALWPE
ncbi:Nudix family hydrolase [Novilysobacter spongiicola]|uniref:8-oxo-dGTP diphosphatase n=1 Tax=Lysobacter spongiicola DSM 21749 TaxID=1122188 RepID=A0A1T4RU75_9GAMM|nr:Nudix family hydrolase [Lysobacter spongiicola]SKA19529.1 8-oxo-dGTP diphosphatase [Lysobacter spongiicola DSM 21749]